MSLKGLRSDSLTACLISNAQLSSLDTQPTDRFVTQRVGGLVGLMRRYSIATYVVRGASQYSAKTRLIRLQISGCLLCKGPV